MNPTKEKFNEDLDAISSQLELGVKSGKFSWADVQERVKDATSELTRSTDQYLHEYTWTSLAVIGGLGVVLGFLAARRD